MSDPAVRALFVKPDGRVLGEGDRLTQDALAQTIATIRVDTAGALYGGARARRFAEAFAAAGARFSPEALAGYRTEMRPLIERSLGDVVMNTTDTPAGRALADSLTRFGNGPARESDLPRRAAGVPALAAGAPGATGFLAVDSKGLIVACGLSMGRPLGSGRMAPGTGLIMASREARPDGGAIELAIVRRRGEPRLAIAGPALPGTAEAVAFLGVEAARFDTPLATLKTLPAADVPRHAYAICVRSALERSGSCDVRTDSRGAGLGFFEFR